MQKSKSYLLHQLGSRDILLVIRASTMYNVSRFFLSLPKLQSHTGWFIPFSNYILFLPLVQWRSLFICACMLSYSVVSDFLLHRGQQPTRLLGPWDFPGKHTEVGCHFLLHGCLRTQGLSLCLLHWQADSLPLSYLGSPSIT